MRAARLLHYAAICIALGAGIAMPAHADRAAADACAKALPPLAHDIYDAVLPDLKPDDDLRAALKAKVRPMVISGKVTRDEAKPSAVAAGKCLYLAQH